MKLGDEQAWEDAFRYFWPIALRAARRGAPHLVEPLLEEAASDAMLKFVRQIDQITSLGHAEAFVRIAASRAAISLARKESARKRNPPDIQHSTLPADPEGLTDIELREVMVILARILKELDSMTRLCLLERANGLTSEEIGKKHSLPLGTVCTKVARGLAAVRAELQKNPSLMKALRHYLR